MVVDSNVFLATHHDGIVPAAGISNHCAYFFFWDRHQCDVFIADEGSCAVEGDVAIYEVTDGIYVVDDGYRTSCGDKDLHSSLFRLFDCFYCRGWNLMCLE